MKGSIFLLFLVWFFCDIQDGLGQNWSPVRFDRKLIFSTPDTIQRYQPQYKSIVHKGRSLHLVRWDTTYIHNDTLEASSVDCGTPILLKRLAWADGQANNTLFGNKVKAINGRFHFEWHQPFNPNWHMTNAVVQFSKTEGDTVIRFYPGKAYQFFAVVDSLITELDLDGNQDSVVVLRTTGPNSGIEIKYSKNFGLKRFPHRDMYGVFSYYDLFKDYDDDYQNIKSFHNHYQSFKVGDRMSYSSFYDYWGFPGGNWGSFLVPDICSGVVVRKCYGLASGGAQMIDSLIIGTCPNVPPGTVAPVSYQVVENPIICLFFEICNKPLSSSPGFGSETKIAFLSDSGLLFVGGYLEGESGPRFQVYCTRLPISFERSSSAHQGIFSHYESFPMYFSRSDTVLGKLEPQIFIYLSKTDQMTGGPLSTVYPNPNTVGRFKISPGVEKGTVIHIFNSQGKCLSDLQVGVEGEVMLHSKLSAGIYILRFRSKPTNAYQTARLIVE